MSVVRTLDGSMEDQVAHLREVTEKIRELGRQQLALSQYRGDVLLWLWEEHGLTYAELARILGTSDVTIYKALLAARKRRAKNGGGEE